MKKFLQSTLSLLVTALILTGCGDSEPRYTINCKYVPLQSATYDFCFESKVQIRHAYADDTFPKAPHDSFHYQLTGEFTTLNTTPDQLVPTVEVKLTKARSYYSKKGEATVPPDELNTIITVTFDEKGNGTAKIAGTPVSAEISDLLRYAGLTTFSGFSFEQSINKESVTLGESWPLNQALQLKSAKVNYPEGTKILKTPDLHCTLKQVNEENGNPLFKLDIYGEMGTTIRTIDNSTDWLDTFTMEPGSWVKICPSDQNLPSREFLYHGLSAVQLNFPDGTNGYMRIKMESSGSFKPRSKPAQ